MKIRTSTDLLWDQLRDIHSFETMVENTLPGLADQAGNRTLAALLRNDRKYCTEQRQTVEDICERHGWDPHGDECKAMKGLIDGGNSHLSEVESDEVRDLMLVAHCGRIKHYEIAAYRFSADLALSSGFTEDGDALAGIADEEELVLANLESVGAGLLGASTVEGGRW